MWSGQAVHGVLCSRLTCSNAPNSRMTVALAIKAALSRTAIQGVPNRLQTRPGSAAMGAAVVR